MSELRASAAKHFLAGAAAILAILAAANGNGSSNSDDGEGQTGRTEVSPSSLASKLAAEVEHEDDHVTALELAQWIRERKPGLRVLDVRSDSEFAAYHIPSAERMPLGTIATLKPDDRETLVLYSEGGAHAAQGWVLLRAMGHRNVYFLRGGLLDWMEDVMNPALPADTSRARIAALSRYFGGTPRAGVVPLPVTGATRPRAPDSTATTAASAVARMRRRGC
jgi:rhodanese-related sulfurtransferase